MKPSLSEAPSLDLPGTPSTTLAHTHSNPGPHIPLCVFGRCEGTVRVLSAKALREQQEIEIRRCVWG